ncbi:hypothetical protein BBF96_11555 [Anoxybacter fermentans]|uniref:Outer membrane protein beta-barrel domain-containing protein n=1 Tax=Anoxybacter fermentans TaxID=1323375 RepID=A0A3S9T0E6_9FIRM|nr:YjbH domain-containing protein [Anoxybacter fermentans]AZR73970.1 hypothetical protein BBF96_11555 [Anoxybacter fermentans]
MKKLTFITTVMLVIFLAIPALANSLQGTKGLIYMPSADTQLEGKYSLGLQIMGNDNESTISLNYGVWENFEVYMTFNFGSGFDNSNVNGGIKARVMYETELQPSLAIGIMGKDLFVVASKTVDYKTNLRGHIGIGTGRFDGLYFGFNKLYNPITITSSDNEFLLPVTNFKLEFYNNQINLGADFHLNEYFVLNLGVINFREFTYGIGYTSLF